MAKRNVSHAVDQAAINKERGYKVVLMRISTKEGPSDSMRWVMTEGRDIAEVQDEKDSLVAQGFFAAVWNASTTLFIEWQRDCNRGRDDQGLSEEALEMLRSKFSVLC